MRLDPIVVEVVAPDWFDWLVFGVNGVAALGAVFAAAVALRIANRDHRERKEAERQLAAIRERQRQAVARLVHFSVHRGSSTGMSQKDRMTNFRVRVENEQPTAIGDTRLTLWSSVAPDTALALPVIPLVAAHDHVEVDTDYLRELAPPAEITWEGRFRDVEGYEWIVGSDGSVREAPFAHGISQPDGSGT